jgi:lysozyme
MNKLKPVIVDLSHHQSDVQFGILRNEGVQAVILKATQGTYYKDDKFTEYVGRARSKGLLVGAYHFMTGEDPQRQLDLFLSTIKAYRPLVVCLDYEGNPNAGGNPTPSILSAMVKGCVKALGRHPVLYGSDASMLGKVLAAKATDPETIACRRWIARYGPNPPKTPCDIWQYTSSANIAGMGPLDANAFVSRDFPSVTEFWRRQVI